MAQKQHIDFTWALPIFSKYLIGLKKFVPLISRGRRFFFEEIFTPKFLRGLITLPKSLLDKLLSPIIFTLPLDPDNIPSINLAKVPEFPASIIQFFFILKLFKPIPSTS